MFDIVIRNAFLVDGSGAPGRNADIAITGSVISEVGQPGTIGAGKWLTEK
jgi:N-acyl-D-aspartate/D-glutamate deacylase